jgi:hypothetical protein
LSGGAGGGGGAGITGGAAGTSGNGGTLASGTGGRSGVGGSPPVDAGSDAPVGPYKRVFLSSTLTTSGNLGGIAAVDASCQSLADAQMLGGTWKAWLSDQMGSPATRFTQATIPYRLVDGTLVANDWTELTSGTLVHPIDHEETGALATGVTEVWTGTLPDGTYEGDSCKNWSNGSVNPFLAEVGTFDQADYRWTAVYLQFCDRGQLRIYCFEQ